MARTVRFIGLGNMGRPMALNLVKRGAGHIAICMSRIDPLVARRLGGALAARGVAMLDAPATRWCA